MFTVGEYGSLRKIAVGTGLDAHHVGQQAVMKNLLGDFYNSQTAPAILVPKTGHTVSGAGGVVSRTTEGLNSARQVVARDIFELRRVYPDVPNSSLQQLIDMNKTKYPGAFNK